MIVVPAFDGVVNPALDATLNDGLGGATGLAFFIGGGVPHTAPNDSVRGPGATNENPPTLGTAIARTANTPNHTSS